MKRIIIGLAVLMMVNTAYAAGKMGFFESLLKGLKSKVGSKLESKNRVSAVAAVRGKKQGVQAEALYWKGGVSDKAEKKLAGEKQQLTEAVQLVVDGDNAGGKAALEKFLKENPDSVYAQDAKEALANISEEGAPAVTGAAGDAEKPAAAPKKPAKPADDEDE
ncbi:MAG: hypothetical protein A3J79_04180 [Elusimicrobia bacterium RIFOXYB2_FULL_62_6]|nr:MAG: hypothetical protein A3J79_04180 [Elusimicrobia bacterium RIFOXYB2_FULL_62_6]